VSDDDVRLLAGCGADQLYRSGDGTSATLFAPTDAAIKHVLGTVAPWDRSAHVVVAQGEFMETALMADD
jgi:hypothetical protein